MSFLDCNINLNLNASSISFTDSIISIAPGISSLVFVGILIKKQFRWLLFILNNVLWAFFGELFIFGCFPFCSGIQYDFR